MSSTATKVHLRTSLSTAVNTDVAKRSLYHVYHGRCYVLLGIRPRLRPRPVKQSKTTGAHIDVDPTCSVGFC